MSFGSKYRKVVLASESVSWQIDDVLPENTILKFDKPYLPYIVDNPSWKLDEAESLDLNHIFSNSYINIFAFIEEYIIALMVNIASDSVFGDSHRLRSLLRFADEEVKHQMLFRRFCRLFENSFKANPKILQDAREMADVILNNTLPAVLLATFHLEIITQEHYNSLKNITDVDELFKKMLKLHWIEEAQHSKVDELELEIEAGYLSGDEKVIAVRSYLNILEGLSDLFALQASFDVDCFLGIYPKHESDKLRLVKKTHELYRTLFIKSGLTHQRFREHVENHFEIGQLQLTKSKPMEGRLGW